MQHHQWNIFNLSIILLLMLSTAGCTAVGWFTGAVVDDARSYPVELPLDSLALMPSSQRLALTLTDSSVVEGFLLQITEEDSLEIWQRTSFHEQHTLFLALEEVDRAARYVTPKAAKNWGAGIGMVGDTYVLFLIIQALTEAVAIMTLFAAI
ncbi:hypothetical protein KQI63_04565 [bacterium]|nr:hypothetical protein [bacterium]